MNKAIFMKDIEGFPTSNSLFTTIQTLSNIFEGATTADLQLVAEEYFVHSATKRLSPLCQKWNEEAVDITAFINKVASALVTRYGDNWKRIYDAYFRTSYKPLNNYDMRETELPNLTDETTINTKTNLVNNQKSKIYGFNTESDPVGDNETEVMTTGDKDKNETTSKTTRKGSRTLMREGNIGVTTSQQMLQSELDLRRFDYWKSVFADIDRLLCFMIYAL